MPRRQPTQEEFDAAIENGGIVSGNGGNFATGLSDATGVITDPINDILGFGGGGGVGGLSSEQREAQEAAMGVVDDLRGFAGDFETSGPNAPGMVGVEENYQYMTPADRAVGANEIVNAPAHRSSTFSDNFSQLTGLGSAFDELGLQDSNWQYSGPSSFDGLQDEFANLGPSAFGGIESEYGDLSFDDAALADMGQSRDYFGGLMRGGSDPIADAQFAQRTADAEQARRAQTEAALADLEMSGQGGAGARLLAELSGNQQMASDMYGAGMDANAMAAARRDNAAGSYGDIGERMGQNIFMADESRAGGMDSMATQQAQGLDLYGLGTAEGSNSFSLGQAEGQDAYTGAMNAGIDSYNARRAEGLDQQSRSVAEGMDTFELGTDQGEQDWMATEGQWALDADTTNAGTATTVADQNFTRDNVAADLNTETANNTLRDNATGEQTNVGTYLDALGAAGNTAVGQQNALTAAERAEEERRAREEAQRNRIVGGLISGGSALLGG